MWRDKRDRVMFILTVVLAVGVVEVANVLDWSDQTLMAVAFAVAPILAIVWFAYELHGAPRIPRR